MKMINTLAVSRIKYNKSRTILTVISIMLTTVLLMGLGTSAASLVDINRQQAVFSGNTHARLLSLSEEQVMMLSSHMDVEALRIRNTFATVEYEKMNGILTFSKDLKEGIYQGIGNIIEGRAAESVDEIYGPSAFLREWE